MGPREIVEILIESDGPVNVRSLIEASIYLPNRSSRWVATFRDETGRQVWRTTGLRSRKLALALARQWEKQARLKRAGQGALPCKPTIRVRPGSGEEAVGLMTQKEVAAIMRISERAVREIERRAFAKIRHQLKAFWAEWESGEVQEAIPQPSSEWALTRAEIAAVYALAQTMEERRVLRKLFGLMQAQSQSD